MSKKVSSRESAEKAENLPEVNSELPGNKIQTEQQIQNTDEAMKTKPAESSFSKRKVEGKGSALKQEVISDVLTGSPSSTGMGISAGGRGVSGTMGGILGAANSTPQADQARGKTRVEKKLDRIATKLNFTPSEQVILTVDESKPLADAADADQGYNGTYRNESARSQKIAGAVPGELLFQRSVDLIMKDKLYFVEGQHVFQVNGERTNLNPTSTYNARGEKKDVIYHSGDFLHKAFHFGLNSDGSVKYFYADVDDITPANVSAEDANVASAARIIKMNVAELDRMVMDTKAGDEKADIWTPLARAIDEPTQAAYLMSSIEAETGAYVYLAYAKASTNMAYQLNRGPKDGLDILTPAIEQCVGWRHAANDSAYFKTAFEDLDRAHIFKKECYRLGDPTIMIDAYDSISKYHNKADLLLQPRGWRMHLQTADNNINPLKVPPLFANVYAGNECFSTIDRDYDPILPICMTDKANLVLVHNLNEQCAFYKGAGVLRVDAVTTTTNIASDYSHDEIVLAKADAMKKMGWTNAYIYEKHDTLDGIDYVENVEGKLILKYNADSGNKANQKSAVEVRSVAYTSAELLVNGFTLVDTVTVASNSKDIVFYAMKVSTGITKAVNSIDEFLNDWTWVTGAPYRYRYSDLRNNYNLEVKHPLVFGLVKYFEEGMGAKFRALLDQEDFYIPLVFSTQYMTLAQLIICAATPFITQVRQNSMKDVIYYEDNVGSYPYSKLDSIRNVPFKNYLNFGFTDYDHPLETKIMSQAQALTWVMPEFFWNVGTRAFVLPWYFNENDLNADGTVNDDASNMSMPSIRSGVRLAQLDQFYGVSEKDIRLSFDRMTKTFLRDTNITAKYAYKYGRNTDGQIAVVYGSGHTVSLGAVLSCPRELGLVMEAPLGVLTVDAEDALDAGDYTLKSLTDQGTATSFRIKIWANTKTPKEPTPLAASSVNIDRGSNYIQKWYELSANGSTSFVSIAGLVFAMGDDAHEFTPFAQLGTGADAGAGITVDSYQRSLYTRLQFLPFVISPFDGIQVGAHPYDIYDLGYMFGLAGFRASDYRESVYNREKEVVNQGLTFVEDPWVSDSPIISGAAKGTGLKLTKGYELK